MANEWVKVELYGANNDGEPRRYAVADTVSVSKGTLMMLEDGRIASGANVHLAPIAGVASMDKEAGDGSPSISCWTNGLFGDVTASGPITAGAGWGMAELDNQIEAITAGTTEGAALGGYTFDTIAVSATGSVRLML